MTQLLIKALEAAIAGPSEKKALSESIVARELASFEQTTGTKYMVQDGAGKLQNARELLLSEAIESTTLIQTEINRTIMEGQEPAKCFRQAVPIFQMNANAMQINLGETGTYAPFVAEGAEIPINNQSYTARTWTAKKFGERPMITREMVNDSLFSVIEMEVRKTGYRVENTLNQWMLQVLMDNAGNEHDINAAAGSVAGIVALAFARAALVDDGFIPDTCIVNPNETQYLFKDFIPSYNILQQGYMNNGNLPPMLGMRLFECGVDCDTLSAPTVATQAWGDATDGNMGYLVYDSKSAGGIGMRQDLRVEQYNDPIRDLVGMSVTMRAACQYGVANAICRIEMGGK